jgi:hypothetical protein
MRITESLYDGGVVWERKRKELAADKRRCTLIKPNQDKLILFYPRLSAFIAANA